ncbi:hypothetical protein D8674_010549 [Pyrus ussuriensis x Pyrus communis]|uniref:Uncharacterized protein n=1 Tax=Pyrus ussuriensis x Pyrus communis TaxID=2448454 RepID=A0A5N5FB17_9ROSA|nr:hypothetical protein D8674_010549 [Pyrus ussuriensis x Pyrus communis]
MRAAEDEGWNEFTETVWISPLDVYVKMVGLVREPATKECKDVKGLDDDEKVVIYTSEGQHVGTKRKVSCTRATLKSV